MSNKYFAGNKGHYIFCDICGQACYAAESVKLSMQTGRGGCIVCPNDADLIDPGTIPYALPTEKSVQWARVNHTDVTNGTSPLSDSQKGALS
jgi:hypothetical protein